MNEPIQCRVCDGVFDPDLHVCPFCGAPRLPDAGFEEIVDASLSRMEALRAGGDHGRQSVSPGRAGLDRMDAMLARLELIEADLDAFLSEGMDSAGIDTAAGIER